MKHRFLPIVVSCAFLGSAALAAPVLQNDDVVAICGDSLTEQKEYSIDIEEYLLMCQPAANVKTLQCGWSGSTMAHLATHMRRDVLTFSPTVATVEFGVNDSGFNTLTADPAIATTYRDALIKVIANFQRGSTRTVIIGSPAVADSYYFKNPRHSEVSAVAFNESLGQLGEIVRQVAASTKGVVFADIHNPLMTAMEKSKAQYGERYPFSSEMDGLHGGANEHIVIAYGFLKAMGFDGNIGTIVYDDSTGRSTATDGHRVLSSQPGKVVIESTRYPYCFFHGRLDGDQQNSPTQFTGDYKYGTVAILPFVPFNHDLNRFTLIIRNLKSPKAKITWGEESREFSSAQLAQGINLAAEFLKNPFVPSFAEVERQVVFKQTFETDFITHFLTNESNLIQTVPSNLSSIKKMEAGFRDVHQGLLANCSEAVKPVVHTIQIEDLAAN